MDNLLPAAGAYLFLGILFISFRWGRLSKVCRHLTGRSGHLSLVFVLFTLMWPLAAAAWIHDELSLLAIARKANVMAPPCRCGAKLRVGFSHVRQLRDDQRPALKCGHCGFVTTLTADRIKT